MKTLALALFAAAVTAGYAQSFPLTFETATPGMLGYDNASFSIVPNPSLVGNPSANVAKIVKVSATNLFAGGKITGMTSLNFSTASTSVLALKVFTAEPAGTVIKIKLEAPYTGEVDAVTTVSGAWETLLFDFGIPASNGSADLVIMPQPFTPGGNKVFYFDDIYQIEGALADPLPGLPITFETGITEDNFFDFESALLSVIPNPHVNAGNPSATVGKIVRYLGAPFGGSKITFTNNLDFSVHTEISMKIWTSAPAGTYVTLKTEKPFWGVERSVQTTQTGQWETLTFNFAGVPNDMPSLVFLFDFVAGSTATGNGSAQSTFYFDDVKFTTIPLSVNDRESPKNLVASPNPSSTHWTLTPSGAGPATARLYSVHGALLAETVRTGQEPLSVDAAQLASGTYVLVVATEAGTEVLRVQKI